MTSIRFNPEREQTWEQWLNRYPSWVNGGLAWREQSYNGEVNWNPPALPAPLPLPQRVPTRLANPPRPRVFISHRQADLKFAERIADLADQAGFYYWLDAVHLPPPPVIANMTALSIALRIEMALLNCSHVVAAYTDNSQGSTWIPYEYGRVKEPVLRTTACCTWLYVKDPNTTVPEWVELNEKREHEKPLVGWFDAEFKNWILTYGGNPTKPAGFGLSTTAALP